MTPKLARIQILGPSELDAFLRRFTGTDRAQLSEGLFRLLELHASYLAGHEHTRVGTIIPMVPRNNDEVAELSWTIRDNPHLNGSGGTHVLTGGLIRHNDGVWGIHT